MRREIMVDVEARPYMKPADAKHRSKAAAMFANTVKA